MSPHAHASGLLEHFARLGVAIIEHALTSSDLLRMDEAFPALLQPASGASAADFFLHAHAWLAKHDGLLELASRLSGERMRVTGLHAVDGSARVNWFAPWHQGRRGRSHGRAIAACQPELELFVHLDECDENNGPLEVIPGSHKLGILDAAAIEALTTTTAPVLCLAGRGDIVALQPLAVHRSQRPRQSLPRRVIHVELIAAKDVN